jgi:MFS family permease
VRARLSLGLSRELWLVQAGIFLNMLGYGAVLPFEIIYLHNGRGFSVGVAGLVLGAVTGVAVVAAPMAGPLIDRHGARVVAVGAGIALATLSPPDRRHRATAVSRVAGNAGIGIGGALGGLVAATGLTGFVALFLANAVSYLVYVCVLAAIVRDGVRPEPVAGGYRVLVRDRAFIHLACINVAVIAVGWGVFTWLLPPYARNVAGISTPLIGLLLLANAATVVVAQVPVARLAEGRRRVVMIALAGSVFAGACLLVIASGHTGAPYPVLLIASVAVGAGECFHTTAVMPLVADLAPPGLRGRYMASMGLSWWAGLAIAPTLGAQLLGRSPAATFLAAAVVAAAAAVSALTLERRLPAAAVLTPHPRADPC